MMGPEVYLHALEWDECFASLAGCLAPEKGHRYPLGGAQGKPGVGDEDKNLLFYRQSNLDPIRIPVITLAALPHLHV